MKRDAVYLDYILECMRRIAEDTAEGKRRFLESHTLQDAVLRNLHTMTETTQRLSPKLKAAYPEIEWERIAGFRNVLVHDYLGVDVERVWRIVRTDVLRLKKAVLQMRRELL